MVCTSLRGAAFFGASIHIAVGGLLFARFVAATILFHFHNFNNLFNERVTIFVAPFMLYVTLILATGIFIFHSVEKEYFLLLKWSSVAFSLLQLTVFASILILKISPQLDYDRFLPPSLVLSFSKGQTSSSTPSIFPALEEGPPSSGTYITVPHGSTIHEKEIVKVVSSGSGGGPSSDPPDPGGGGGGGGGGLTSSGEVGEEMTLRGIIILGLGVVLTLVYLFFLFLYIRQLNAENTGGHVYGHATAVTRNVAFYVQPQFHSQDNNKSYNVQVQRVAGGEGPLAAGGIVVAPSPNKKVPQQQQQQQQQQLAQQLAPHHHHHHQKGGDQQQQDSPQGFSPARRAPLGGVASSPKSRLAHQEGSGGGPGGLNQGPGPGVVGLNQGPGLGVGGVQGPGHTQTLPPSLRGPIPAQVRIGFYPHEISRPGSIGSSDTQVGGPRFNPHQQLHAQQPHHEFRDHQGPVHHASHPMQGPPTHHIQMQGHHTLQGQQRLQDQQQHIPQGHHTLQGQQRLQDQQQHIPQGHQMLQGGHQMLQGGHQRLQGQQQMQPQHVGQMHGQQILQGGHHQHPHNLQSHQTVEIQGGCESPMYAQRGKHPISMV